MVIAGLVVGVYFAYDSYLKLALHQVNAYSMKAFQYSLDRAGLTANQANQMRISEGYRSLGLLESHGVSAAWVILGTLAALSLIPTHRVIARRSAVFVASVLLLMGLNFTALTAFGTLMLLFEFGGSALLRGRVRRTAWRDVTMLASVVTVTVITAFAVAGDKMSLYINKNLVLQLDLLLGTGAREENGFFHIFLRHAKLYVEHLQEYPLTLLIGDGVAKYGGFKGGDIGHVDNLQRFGLPFYGVSIVALIQVVRAGTRKPSAIAAQTFVGDTELSVDRLQVFVSCVVLMVLVMDGHYSVWAAKSIFPILCFSLAMFDRHLRKECRTSGGFQRTRATDR
jgi:hypothetical protein